MKILIGIILFITYLIICKLSGYETDGINFVLNLDTILDFIVCFFGIAFVEEYVYRMFLYNKILELTVIYEYKKYQKIIIYVIFYIVI